MKRTTRVVSFIFSLLMCASAFSSCAVKTVENDIKYIPSETKQDVADIAYTGGRLDLASKDGFYESFDDIEVGTVYGTGDSESSASVGAIHFVPKMTKFDIVKSSDGNVLHYFRSANANDQKKDPYLDVNISEKIAVEKHIAQVDLKLANDFAVKFNVIQSLYRKSGANLVSLSVVTCEQNGNLTVGGKVIGALSKNEYTNVAVMTDPVNFTYIVYINGVEKASGSYKKSDLTGYSFTQVRYVQAGSNNGTGGVYLDNIAVYSGETPTAFIPTENATHTVNEDFNNLQAGNYSSSKIRFDNKTAQATVKISDDKNGFLSCKLLGHETTVSFADTLLSGGDYIISSDFYLKQNDVEFSFDFNGTELYTVGKDGKVRVGGDVIARLEFDTWQTLSVAIYSSGFSVYQNGRSVYDDSVDMSSKGGTPKMKLTGSEDSTLFMDNVRIYRARLPFNYSGNPRDVFTLVDSSKASALSGKANFTVSNDYKNENGDPLIKITNLNGQLVKVATEQLGFTDDPSKYGSVRLRFYCPEDYNYAVLFILDCGQNSEGWCYYSDYIYFDEPGWVTVEFDILKMSPSRHPSISTLGAISFEVSGWAFGATENVKETESAQNKEVTLYLDKIELIKK